MIEPGTCDQIMWDDDTWIIWDVGYGEDVKFGASHAAHGAKVLSVLSWTSGESIAVQCAHKTFLHSILSDPDDDAPEFVCPEEDPVSVNLTDDERHQLELAI
jgi:hypothetical protein